MFLIHGWPELAYSWKNQLPALAEAGFRAIAVDVKGFGASDAPADIDAYSIDQMTCDLAALADVLDIERAIWCGHDWGGWLVWGMGQLRPEKVAGVIGVSTPLRPRPPAPPISILKKRFTEKHYFVQFQEEEVPEKLFEENIEKFFRLTFRGPAPREDWARLVPRIFDLPGAITHAPTPPEDTCILSEEDLAVYIEAYRKSGFKGGINLYRNVDRNWQWMEGRDETVRAPSLWIGAELDLFLPPESAEGMEKLVPDLEKQIIADCGHWVMWEKPAELNAALIAWLKDKF